MKLVLCHMCVFYDETALWRVHIRISLAQLYIMKLQDNVLPNHKNTKVNRDQHSAVRTS